MWPIFAATIIVIMTTVTAPAEGVESVADEAASAYLNSPFASFSTDYFARFSRDLNALPGEREVALEPDWRVLISAQADPLVKLMAGHLAEFLNERMGVSMVIETTTTAEATASEMGVVVLQDRGGGVSEVPGSFTITVTRGQVRVAGADPAGLRDGIVQLVDQMGFRQAPFLARGEVTFKPRLGLRCGVVPWLGSYRDAVFMGYNAVIITVPAGSRKGVPTSLYALSTSMAIPELAQYRDTELRQNLAEEIAKAHQYGLKTFCVLRRWQAFPVDHPVFMAHPEIRGAEVRYGWYANQPSAGYIPCTEAPLVRRFLSESVRNLFQDLKLDGVCAIIGGEEFEHCFMRAAGVPQGHTNCVRCQALGAETAVSNLCNYLAAAAREANPEALFVAWPYSAQHVWSADETQEEFIERLQPGTALLTEIEKDEVIAKPEGFNKVIWDYSIDFIGPSRRAQRQIETCRRVGIPVFLKGEPELAFEAPGLPEIPCLDRWLDRAEALAASGADGAWVFPFFRQCYGTTSAEVHKLAWWNPVPDPDTTLAQLADRIAGRAAGPHLRRAWALVSAAIELAPELPPYYAGPGYLGPAHPLLADPEATLPETIPVPNPEGRVIPTARGDLAVWGELYQRMATQLTAAVAEVRIADPLVPERCRMTFAAETWPLLWLWHTARTQANFYHSCTLRQQLQSLPTAMLSAEEHTRAQTIFDHWLEVMLAEKANAEEALEVMQADVRLDFPYHSHMGLPPGVELIRAKLVALDHDINIYLPALAKTYGLRMSHIP